MNYYKPEQTKTEVKFYKSYKENYFKHNMHARSATLGNFPLGRVYTDLLVALSTLYF